MEVSSPTAGGGPVSGCGVSSAGADLWLQPWPLSHSMRLVVGPGQGTPVSVARGQLLHGWGVQDLHPSPHLLGAPGILGRPILQPGGRR